MYRFRPSSKEGLKGFRVALLRETQNCAQVALVCLLAGKHTPASDPRRLIMPSCATATDPAARAAAATAVAVPLPPASTSAAMPASAAAPPACAPAPEAMAMSMSASAWSKRLRLSVSRTCSRRGGVLVEDCKTCHAMKRREPALYPGTREGNSILRTVCG